MYRFLWKPRWILSHVLVAGLIVTMILLMFWQLRRLDEKKELNALITARSGRASAEVADALAEADVESPGDGQAIEFRATEVVGAYDTANEFTVPSKTLNGAPGRLVVTPLVPTDPDHETVLVLRGFIPQAVDDTSPPIDGVEPPEGEVRVLGWLRQTQTPEGLQSTIADLGNDSFARIDIARIEAARGADYAPAYLQLGAQEPATESGQLSLYPLPERTEGPHFSYAAQWGIFTLIAIIGYPLVLRRVARTRTEGEPHEETSSA